MKIQMERFGVWIGILGFLMVLSGENGRTAERGMDGAEALAGELAKNHNDLVGDAQKQALDEINRQIREAGQQIRRAETDDSRRAFQTQREAAGQKLAALLDQCPALARISINDQQLSTSKKEAFVIPGDIGALLLRVETGGDDIRFQVVNGDFANGSAMIPIAIAPKAVSWVLVELSHVPKQITSPVIEFQLGEGKKVRWPIAIKTPTPGRLKVKILAEETGKPTPAMVRLVWKKNGTDRKPANAIDFAPQFDQQGSSSGYRRAVLPGKLGGSYWCVPGPFDMELPAGDWEITVRRGVEHVALTESFTVPPGEVVEKTYTLRRWVDMRKRDWYSGDDHVHCQILSDADAERLMAWVQAEDIHLANVVKMGDIYRTWFEQRGFGKEYRVIQGDTILSPGQECPRTHNELGHTLSMNIQEMVRDTEKYYLYDWVFDTVHAQGGLSGYAHVLSDMFYVHRDMSINIPKDKIDFVELMQFGNLGTDLFYDFLNTGFKLAASAGSDVPWGGTVGEVRVYAYVGKNSFTADKWFEAVKQGRTFVTNGPMLEFHVDQSLPGDEIHIQKNRKLRVRAHAWCDPNRAFPASLEIMLQGEAVRRTESTDGSKKELSIDFEIEAGDGFWIAARAQGSDGSKAHTTPVYVVRDPLRFWKIDAVEVLIAKRLTSLEEVEKIVADAKEKIHTYETAADRSKTQLAAQGPELLKRVAAARDIYNHLKQVIAQERTIRARTH